MTVSGQEPLKFFFSINIEICQNVISANVILSPIWNTNFNVTCNMFHTVPGGPFDWTLVSGSSKTDRIDNLGPAEVAHDNECTLATLLSAVQRACTVPYSVRTCVTHMSEISSIARTLVSPWWLTVAIYRSASRDARPWALPRSRRAPHNRLHGTRTVRPNNERVERL